MTFASRIASTYLLLLCNGLSADEPKIPAARAPDVCVEVQIVTLPRDIALPLVREMMDKTKIEGAYARLQSLLSAGTGTLVGWPIVTVSSGERAVIDANDEIRYASEFDLPTIDFIFDRTTDKNGPHLTRRGNSAGQALNPVPVSFETRNAGVSLEVEPKVSTDRKSIDLNFQVRHVRPAGVSSPSVDCRPAGAVVTVEQPKFDTIVSTISTTLRNGERMLLSVAPISEPPDHLELFILKAATTDAAAPP